MQVALAVRRALALARRNAPFQRLHLEEAGGARLTNRSVAIMADANLIGAHS